MIRRLGYSALFLLAACGQQSSLELAKDQIFSKQFPPQSMVLPNDGGADVTLTPKKLASSSGKGFTSTSPGDVYQGCNSWYGCQQNPYSYYTSYSNMAHAWNPSITRTVNLNFGQQAYGWGPTAPLSNPTTGEFCVNLNISSNQPLQVLRSNLYNQGYWYSAGQGGNVISGNGSNVLNVQARVSQVGAIVFALQDYQSLYSNCGGYNYGYGYNGWQPGNWWDFGYNGGYGGYGYTSCGASSGQATLKITGTAGLCGQTQQPVNIDATAQVNSQSGYDPYSYYNTGYNMPYFSSPAGVWGRVIQYQGNQGLNFYGL